MISGTREAWSLIQKASEKSLLSSCNGKVLLYVHMLYWFVLIEILGQSVFLAFIFLARHLITFYGSLRRLFQLWLNVFEEEFFCGGCYILHFLLLASQVHEAVYVGCMFFKIFHKISALSNSLPALWGAWQVVGIGHASMSFLSVSWTFPLLCRQLGTLNMYF